MIITTRLPKRAVLSRKFPTDLPKSADVDGAYRHSFQLRDKGVTLEVTYHIQARGRKELRNASKWQIREMESSSDHATFLLTPASIKAQVTMCGLAIERGVDEHELLLRFDAPEDAEKKRTRSNREQPLFLRRFMRASAEFRHLNA